VLAFSRAAAPWILSPSASFAARQPRAASARLPLPCIL
jgi:hypothetical protein